MNLWFRKSLFEKQMAAEFRFHLETRVNELVGEGLSRHDAEARARSEFGAVELAKDECRDQRPLEWLEDLWRDVRLAARALRRNPGFALTAVITLALGIGANAAIFSVVNAFLLRALPYPDASRLVRLGEKGQVSDVSIPEYQFWKEHAKVFSSSAGYRGGGEQRVSVGSRIEWVPAMSITTDFFRTTGVGLAAGREFSSQETSQNGPNAVVISDRLWRMLGADQGILGRLVLIGDASYSVVGISAAEFWFPQQADVFLPLRPSGSVGDEGANTSMIARLAAHVSLQQAAAGMAPISESFMRARAGVLQQDQGNLGVTTFQNWLVGDIRLKLLLLFGAVTLLLLIACLNVASLILARLAARQREIAVRRALGSSAPRLFRQFAVENVLLCLSGGATGLIFARVLLHTLIRQIAFQLPASATVRLDLPVLAFAFGVALVTGLIFTAAPLVASMRGDIFATLRSAGQVAGSIAGGQRIRGTLLVGQVAFSVTLLISAALLIQSLHRLNREALGFVPEGVVTFATPADPSRHSGVAEARIFQQALLQKISILSGVRKVAIVNALPLKDKNNFPTERVGHPDQSIGGMEIRLVSPEYFAAMAIPILRGRSFSDADGNGTAPVVLINQRLARTWWADGDPLGDQVKIGRFHGHDVGDDPVREVVGVVGDTKDIYLTAPPRPTVYVPVNQGEWNERGFSWVVRAGQVKGLEQQIRQAVAAVDPHQRIANLQMMEEIVDSTKASSRFDAWLFGGFAGLALLLTAVGLYGLLSFSVARRTNEIGTRLALGAGRWEVIEMVLWQGLKLVGVGLVLGLVGALVLTHSLSSLLFGVHPADPVSYLAVAILLLSVSLLASYFPARRAAGLDPMAALRSE